MEPNRDTGPLNQGGPSDQASQRPDERDQGMLGSQQGRPQVQAERPERPGDNSADSRAGTTPNSPAGSNAKSPAGEHAPVRGDGEGMSDTERKAGTPDARATTDWRPGAGEPGVRHEPAVPGRPAGSRGESSRS
jgi:hypothetical protein